MIRSPLGSFVKQEMGYETPCWISTTIPMPNGYCRISLMGIRDYAHKHFYKWVKGEIPKGYDIDHLCRVRNCCNPKHLEAVTRQENARRGAGCKLTLEKAKELKSRMNNGENHNQIASEYGISKKTAYDIKCGKEWRDA